MDTFAYCQPASGILADRRGPRQRSRKEPLPVPCAAATERMTSAASLLCPVDPTGRPLRVLSPMMIDFKRRWLGRPVMGSA